MGRERFRPFYESMKILNLIFGSQILFWTKLAAFLVLNILDAHSTYIVMRPDHFERERNPVARWVFKLLGIPRGIIIFKTLLLAILIPAMGFYAGNDLKTINIVLFVADLVFLLVVINNYRIYKRVKLHNSVQIHWHVVEEQKDDADLSF